LCSIVDFDRIDRIARDRACDGSRRPLSKALDDPAIEAIGVSVIPRLHRAFSSGSTR
jgi:hypothetical protein